MVEAGILRADERVELLEGQIRSMAAKGTAHSAATQRTRRLVERTVERVAQVRIQDPVQLDDYSEPEPDIAVVVPDALDYATHHPRPQEVLLLIEVADSTFKYDTQVKALSYGRSGIADYWVLDVNQRQLHVFRQPTERGYQQHQIFGEGDRVSPLAFPNFHWAVVDLLPLR